MTNSVDIQHTLYLTALLARLVECNTKCFGLLSYFIMKQPLFIFALTCICGNHLSREQLENLNALYFKFRAFSLCLG